MAAANPQTNPDDLARSTHLRRIDPARNIARFYDVALEPSLFEDWAVVRRWGRIGGRGRWRLDPCENLDEGLARLTRLIAGKRRRGYRSIGDEVAAD